jgi:ParB family chromosome partitioning protein
LTELAVRYAAVKAEVAAEFANCPPVEAGPSPDQDGGGSGRPKRDARVAAASRLGAGVSHTTLEKVAWLQGVAEDRDRPFPVRQSAFDALEEIDAGEPVDWVYVKVHAMALTAELDEMAGDDTEDPIVRVLARAGAEEARKAEAGHLPPAKVDAAARQAMRLIRRTRRSLSQPPAGGGARSA